MVICRNGITLLNHRCHNSGSYLIHIPETVLPGWPAVLGQNFPEEVFLDNYRQLYHQGRICRIADVDKEEKVSPCLVEFVQQFNVKAKLIVPIIIKEQLWGLLQQLLLG